MILWYSFLRFLYTTPSPPDSIIIIDSQTGEGLSPWTNDFLIKNREMAVLRKEAAAIWKTKKGLEIFGLNHFQDA